MRVRLVVGLAAVAGAAAIGGAFAVANAEQAPGPFRRPLTSLKHNLRSLLKDDIKLPFEKSKLAGTSSTNPTVLQFGPDGRLYVAQQDGLLKAYTIARRSANDYAVTAVETIDAVKRIVNHDDDGSVNRKHRARQVTGMHVTGSSGQPIIYVSSSDPRIGGGKHGDVGVDTNSGVVSRLTHDDDGWKRHDLVRGLPRSEENHAPNGLLLASDRNTLYLSVGSNGNLGAPSRFFAYLPQYALSGAILEIDLRAIGDDTYDLPTLDDRDRRGVTDANDPFGGNDGLNQARLAADGPVQIFAPGFRNAYDLLITEGGAMFSIDNGGNPGQGGLPVGEGAAGRCTNEPNEAEPLRGNVDSLHLIPRRGYYGGSPNPTRGNAANTFSGQSPILEADPRQCEFLGPNRLTVLATFAESTNGLAEYTTGHLDGALQGDLLAASFDNTIYRIDLDPSGRKTLGQEALFTAVGTSPSIPLDVVALSDEDPFPGTIWTVEFIRGDIFVYEPDDYEAYAGLAGD